MKKLVIVTPIWREILKEAEFKNIQVSLLNNKNIDHYFIHEESLTLDFYKSQFKKSKFLKFKKGTFDSIQTYNLLMLSGSFYKKFLEYKYLLILQTDAILVKPVDIILKYNYDYVAPNWKKGFKIPPLFKYKILSKMFQIFGFYDVLFIGNGGLSLRKISTFIELTNKNRLQKFSWMNEDMVFSKVLVKNNFHLPVYKDNLFFIEEEIFPEKTSQAIGYHAHEIFFKK